MIGNLQDFNELLAEGFNTEEYEGFIYLTYCIPEDLYYLGKKSFRHNVKKKLGKKELASIPVTRGRRPTSKMTVKDSGWVNYYGSHKKIPIWLKQYGPENITRGIVKLCKDKKMLTYWENKYLYSMNVLEPGSKFINDNVQGRFFKSDFI